MQVKFFFNLKLVESSKFEFSQPLGPLEVAPELAAEKGVQSPDTPVIPLGSSIIAPGLTMAVEV